MKPTTKPKLERLRQRKIHRDLIHKIFAEPCVKAHHQAYAAWCRENDLTLEAMQSDHKANLCDRGVNPEFAYSLYLNADVSVNVMLGGELIHLEDEEHWAKFFTPDDLQAQLKAAKKPLGVLELQGEALLPPQSVLRRIFDELACESVEFDKWDSRFRQVTFDTDYWIAETSYDSGGSDKDYELYTNEQLQAAMNREREEAKATKERGGI